MLNWETEINPVPETRYTLRQNGVTLQILPRCDESPDECYTHCILQFGRLSKASEAVELKTWPRDAIRQARLILNEFENELEER